LWANNSKNIKFKIKNLNLKLNNNNSKYRDIIDIIFTVPIKD